MNADHEKVHHVIVEPTRHAPAMTHISKRYLRGDTSRGVRNVGQQRRSIDEEKILALLEVLRFSYYDFTVEHDLG